TFPITRELIGQGTTVTDAEVARAVRYAFNELKLVVEPGGVIGLAALLAGKIDVKGKIVVGILSGGNVDVDMLARLIAACTASRKAPICSVDVSTIATSANPVSLRASAMAGGLEALGDGIGNSGCSGTGTPARWVRADSSAGPSDDVPAHADRSA